MGKMTKPQRIALIADIIDLKKLERESRKLLYIGLVIGVFMHIMAGMFISYNKAEIAKKEIKLIKVDFIELPPRLRNPYEDWKRIITQRTYTRKKFRFRIPGGKSTFKSQEAVIDMPRDMDFLDTEKLIQQTLDTQVDIFDRLLSRLDPIVPDSVIPMKNYPFVDTGEYPFELIINPINKKAIQGYSKLLYVWVEKYEPPDTLHHPVIDLAEALNRMTNIEAKPIVVKDYKKDGRIFYYPFVYITIDNFFKLENPNTYLGGLNTFFVIDNDNSNYYSANKVRIAIQRYGFRVRPLPKNHQLYHCFFDFENGPPNGAVKDAPNYIEGLYNGRNLFGVFCPQGYGSLWKNNSNTQQLKFGVNLAVYALSPGKWYDNDRRISYYNSFNHDYNEWYENGQMKYQFTGYGLADNSIFWLPNETIGTKRILPCFSDGGYYYYFDYNGNFEYLIKNFSRWDTDPFNNLKVISWGDYNTYEGWYGDGLKTYYYNYNDKKYIEW